jgi:acyl transferase domain-containing protein
MSRTHDLSPTANDVAIIGMHCRFPGVAGIEAFERILREGANLTSPRVVQENGDRRVELRSAVDHMAEFDADFFNHTPAEASVMDPQQRLFLEAAWELFEQAGYAPGLFPGKVGVFAGVSTSLYLLRHLLNDEDIIRRVGDLQVMIGNDKDHLTSEVAYKLNLSGPCVTVQASCAT